MSLKGPWSGVRFSPGSPTSSRACSCWYWRTPTRGAGVARNVGGQDVEGLITQEQKRRNGFAVSNPAKRSSGRTWRRTAAAQRFGRPNRLNRIHLLVVPSVDILSSVVRRGCLSLPIDCQKCRRRQPGQAHASAPLAPRRRGRVLAGIGEHRREERLGRPRKNLDSGACALDKGEDTHAGVMRSGRRVLRSAAYFL